MSSSNPGLPDGTEDFVGVKAEELEDLRSLFLNFFYKNLSVSRTFGLKKTISLIVWALWRVREVESYALSKFQPPMMLGDHQNVEKTIGRK